MSESFVVLATFGKSFEAELARSATIISRVSVRAEVRRSAALCSEASVPPPHQMRPATETNMVQANAWLMIMPRSFCSIMVFATSVDPALICDALPSRHAARSHMAVPGPALVSEERYPHVPGAAVA